MKHVSTTPRGFALNRAVDRAAGQSPCKDCQERYPGCSGHCKKWDAWKLRVIEVKKQFEQAEKGAKDADAVLIESFDREYDRIRRKRHRRKT